MKKIIGLIIILLAVVGLAYAGWQFTRRPQAGLQIDTGELNLTVYLDQQLIGTTPDFRQQLTPGRHLLTIKDPAGQLADFTRQIELLANYLTVVEWLPHSDSQFSQAVIYQPQPTTDNSTRLTISSEPSNVLVRVDNFGQPQSTPLTYSTADLEPGVHLLTFSLPSYESIIREVDLHPDTQLTIWVQLGKSTDETLLTTTPEIDTEPTIEPAADLPPLGAQLQVLPTGIYQNSQQVLNLKAAADDNSQTLTTLPIGSRLTFLGRTSGDFYQVQVDWQSGWVAKEWVKFVD